MTQREISSDDMTVILPMQMRRQLHVFICILGNNTEFTPW